MNSTEEPTGLTAMQDAIAGGKDLGRMLTTLGQRIVSAEDGEVVVEGTPGPQHDNIQGRTHGAFMAGLIDTAMGAAVITKLPARAGFGTVDIGVKFVRKLDVATGPVYATAKVLHAGRTMFTVECKVADKAGLLYGHGQGTFLVYPK